MPKSEPLDVLLNASLRVSRPVAACSRCRGAKIKCDGKLPACTACERSGKAESCSGANDDFAKGKERSYVAALESACERLQRRITNASSSNFQSSDAYSVENGSGTPSQGNESASSAPTRRFVSGGRLLRREATDVDDLVGDFGYLAVNATARDFYGFSDTMSFAKLMLFSCQKQPFPQIKDNLLPPKYAAVPLIQHYLDNTFVLFPFFSETNLMTSVSAVYSDDGRFSRPSDHFILRMVLAISAASKSRQRDDENASQAIRHVSAAIGFAETVINPGSISGVQALLFLTQFSLFDPLYLSCWDLIGVTSRVMVDLGIHQEPAADLRISKDQLEMRRRVYYCVFALDRHISMSLSRAFSFTDDSAIVELPAVPTVNSVSSPYAGASLFLRPLSPSYHLFSIRILQSRFYHAHHFSSRDTLQTEVAQSEAFQLIAEAYTWFYQAQPALPPQQSRSTSLAFRLEMLYTQILALSSSPRVSLNSDYNKTLLVILATDFLLNLAPAINDPGWYAFLSYLDVLRVSYVANTMLNALWSCYESILSGISPLPPPGLLLPPIDIVNLPSHDMLANVSRMLSALEAAAQVLIWSEQRWGQSMRDFRSRFENESATMVAKLKLKHGQLLNQDPNHPMQSHGACSNSTQAAAMHLIGSNASVPQLTVNTQAYAIPRSQELARGFGGFHST